MRNSKDTGHICVICGKHFVGYGNNPSPINDKPNRRCCDECNWAYVIPARIMGIDKFREALSHETN